MNIYQVVACQGAFWSAHNKEQLNKNIDHALEMIRWGYNCYISRDPVRLFAFGEMNICGIPGLTMEEHRRIAITIPGPETERFVELARELNAYIVPGSWIESDPDYADAIFNTCFLASPEGILAKYRKVNPVPGMELCTSPHNLLHSGYDTKKTPLFPVVKTEIGNIGMFICYDAFFPEVTRQLAYNGAEILVGVTGDFYPGGDSILSYWNSCSRVRSFENMCYGLYVNGGGTVSQTPPISMSGRSQIVDYQGRVLTILDGGEALTSASFNLDMLRHARKSRDLLSQNRREAYDYLKTLTQEKQ
jgi:predicted amidohydrolase